MAAAGTRGSKTKAVRRLLPAAGLSLVALAVILGRGEGSLAMRAATLVLKARGKPLADPEASLKALTSRAYPATAPIPRSFAGKIAVIETIVGENRVLTLAPRAGASRWHIVYYHGGAYVNQLIKPHWDIIEALITATGATVTVPIYPLAPEHTHRDTFPFLAEVYRQLLAHTAPADIVFVGDSAGAGLALGHVIDNSLSDLPAPSRIILFSPWLDLSLADPLAREIEPSDPMLGVDALRKFGAMWAGGDDWRRPRLSPLYADLHNMPPIDLYQGTNDIFVADARTFTRKMRLAGRQIRYSEFPGAFHVFVGATFTPEAKKVYREIGTILPRDSYREPASSPPVTPPRIGAKL